MKKCRINYAGACSLFISLLTIGCHMTYVENEDEGNHRGPAGRDGNSRRTAVFENLFPFENTSNQWHYLDEDGNSFTIQVVDTISDEAELYFKVAFSEDKLDVVQDNWFLRKRGKIQFNSHLRGEYHTFLPSSVKKHGGEFKYLGSAIRYKVLDSMEVGDVTFTNVLELKYSRAILHGFDRIYFADNIGIVRMVDEDGRWEIDYVLEQSNINGEKTEY